MGFNQEQSLLPSPGGQLEVSEDICGCHNLGSAAGFWWVEAGDAAIPQGSLPQLSTPRVNSVEAERPCTKPCEPVSLKGNQPWMFTGRTDAETEAPILWPPDVKSWLTGKDPDAGKDWRQEEKGMTEDEMVK